MKKEFTGPRSHKGLETLVYMVPAAVMPSVVSSERSHFKIKAAVLLLIVAVRFVR